MYYQLSNCRYELPIVFIVMNNNGIYSGLDQEAWSNLERSEDQLGLRYHCPTFMCTRTMYIVYIHAVMHSLILITLELLYI